MSFTPISNTPPQYEENGIAASGYYIKFYESGTSTPTAMATGSTGVTLLDKCQLDTEGYPINGSGSVFIPHINVEYKIALFRNKDDANNNNLANAAWDVDGLFPVSTGSSIGTDFDQIPLNTNIVYPVATVADLRLLTPTLDGQQFSLLEYNAGTGLGGGTCYYDASDTASVDDGGSVFVTATGERIKRIFSSEVNISDFGELSGTDCSINLQNAINYVSSIGGGYVDLDAKTYLADNIELKTRVVLRGKGIFKTKIKANDGWSVGNVIETTDFDTWVYSNGTSLTPRECGFVGLQIDGNADGYTGSATATNGVVCRIAAIRPVMQDFRVIGGPGMGLHTGLAGVDRTVTKWYEDETKIGRIENVKVFGCANDGWVYDGPSDHFLNNVECGVNGWPDTVYTASRPSLIEPTRRVTNLCINTSVELGWVHTFGCIEGYSTIIGRPSYGSGTQRIKIDTLINESSNGGVHFREGARYQAQTIDCHNCYGSDESPYFLDDSTSLQSYCDSLEIVASTNQAGQNLVELLGDHSVINNLKISGVALADTGDGVVVGGFGNKILSGDILNIDGVEVGGDASSGVRIKTGASTYTVQCTVRGSTRVATLEDGYGTANNVDIVSAFGNTTEFINFGQLTASERRDFKLTTLSGGKKTSRGYLGKIENIAATDLLLRELDLPITTTLAPLPEEVALDINYVSGSAPKIDLLMVGSPDPTATTIRVYVRFSEVSSGVVDLVARVN